MGMWGGVAAPHPHFRASFFSTDYVQIDRTGGALYSLAKPYSIRLKVMIPDLNVDPSVLKRAILHTVIYADIFDYPLTVHEIHRYLTGVSASLETVENALPGVLRQMGDYYTLPGRESIVSTRQRRQQIASRLWPGALRFGSLIARLPFVRMVAVTGSLAMDNVENNADLDYLIVTTPGRLWLCRALILALGRLAALQGVRLCPNYIISQRALEFHTRNIYAAHELAQMIPLSGIDVYEQIRALNLWMKEDFLPNADGAPLRSIPNLGATSASTARAWLEALLLTPPGAWLEKWEMDRKIRKLRRENGDNPEAAFSADLCKGHSHRHGQKTEQVLNKKLENILGSQV
jgi:hypothetical protein